MEEVATSQLSDHIVLFELTKTDTASRLLLHVFHVLLLESSLLNLDHKFPSSFLLDDPRTVIENIYQTKTCPQRQQNLEMISHRELYQSRDYDIINRGNAGY